MSIITKEKWPCTILGKIGPIEDWDWVLKTMPTTIRFLGDSNVDDDLESGLVIPTPYCKKDDNDSGPNNPSVWDIRNRQDSLQTVSEASECSSREDP